MGCYGGLTEWWLFGVDRYISNVSLLLHGNGTNGSTTITDSSPSPKTVTVTGNAQISTDQSKFGGSSLVAGTSPTFAWGSNRLTVPAGSAFAYGTGNFTVEAWTYVTSFAGDPSWWTQTTGGINYFLVSFSAGGVPSFVFAVSGGGTTVTGPAVTTNTWNHIAVVRNSGSVTVYTNGIGGTPVACTQDFSNITYVPTIGSYTHTNTQLVYNGYMDELRITKGIARYEIGTGVNVGKMVFVGTNALALPTAPFPDI
tara:strand:+ start:2954 stop:3718 length:765 start_codon:yes stop_codon:yes gene_type:complete